MFAGTKKSAFFFLLRMKSILLLSGCGMLSFLVQARVLLPVNIFFMPIPFSPLSSISTYPKGLSWNKHCLVCMGVYIFTNGIELWISFCFSLIFHFTPYEYFANPITLLLTASYSVMPCSHHRYHSFISGLHHHEQYCNNSICPFVAHVIISVKLTHRSRFTASKGKQMLDLTINYLIVSQNSCTRQYSHHSTIF